MMDIDHVVAIVLGILTAFGVGVVVGQAQSQRECAPVQQHERLLYTEQRPTSTVCQYADQGAGYGLQKKKRQIL